MHVDPIDDSSMKYTRDELRSLTILEGLPDSELDWFCEHGERVPLGSGDRMLERGQVADALWIVVKGVIKGFEEIGGQWLLVATTVTGQVTGMLPFSRMTHYPRHAVAAEPSEVLRLDASRLMELIEISPEVGRRLVAQMSDRVRGDVRLEQQGEKMMALGRLSAGLAHELNNPAAAVRRAATTLSEHRAKLPALVTALVRHHVSEEGLEKLEHLRRLGRERDASSVTELERSEREDDLLEWLENHEIAEPWEVAATFSEANMSVGDLEEVAGNVPEAALGDVLAWLGGGINSDRIVEEIKAAAGRITDRFPSRVLRRGAAQGVGTYAPLAR